MEKIIQEKFEKIDSTHVYALNKKELEAQVLYVITAKEQEAGRGRRDNKWSSLKGNMYVSFTFLSQRPAQKLGHVLTCAVMKVLQEQGIVVQYKWPNDLLYKDKKLCGVLCHKKEDHITLSFGLNVNTSIEKRVCLRQITNKEYDLEQVLDKIVNQFQKQMGIDESNRDILMLRSNLAYKNQMIEFVQNERIHRAKLVDLTEEGALLVQEGDVSREIFSASNIVTV